MQPQAVLTDESVPGIPPEGSPQSRYPRFCLWSLPAAGPTQKPETPRTQGWSPQISLSETPAGERGHRVKRG